jgi:mannose-6-phosphate isomerase-like protein (cupin superfamily)
VSISGLSTDQAAYALLRKPSVEEYRAALAGGEFIGAVGVHYATMPEPFTLAVRGAIRHLHAVGVPPLAAAVPHFHSGSSEHWLMADGELTAWLGNVFADESRVEWDEPLRLPTGATLYVPPAGAHTLRNDSPDKPAIVAILCEKSHMDGSDRTFVEDWIGGTPRNWR